MSAVDGATACIGSHSHKQRRGGDAKERFLPFHVAARLFAGVSTLQSELRENRIARLLVVVTSEYARGKHHRHGGKESPALPRVAHHAPERIRQPRRDQENQEHLEKVAQRRWVFIGVRRV